MALIFKDSKKSKWNESQQSKVLARRQTIYHNKTSKKCWVNFNKWSFKGLTELTQKTRKIPKGQKGKGNCKKSVKMDLCLAILRIFKHSEVFGMRNREKVFNPQRRESEVVTSISKRVLPLNRDKARKMSFLL